MKKCANLARASAATPRKAGSACLAARLFDLVFFVVFAVVLFASCGTKADVVDNPKPDVKQKILIEMVSIPAGSFSMGSARNTPSSLNIEYPAHQVTISAFLLGKYEVTQGQYFEVTNSRPSNFYTNQYDEGPDGWMTLPVEMINWYEAIAFCNRLSIKEKLSPVYRLKGSVNPDDWGDPPMAEAPEWDAVEMISGAKGYRLPTEAEWEYAARGGDGTPGNFNHAGHNSADHVGWHYGNSNFRIHETGKKPPNGLDLHDMSGNVMEWCWDWLGDYSGDSQNNPTGPAKGMYRVIRGGAWSVAVHFARVAYRHSNLPYYRAVNLGFRVARSQ